MIKIHVTNKKYFSFFTLFGTALISTLFAEDPTLLTVKRPLSLMESIPSSIPFSSPSQPAPLKTEQIKQIWYDDAWEEQERISYHYDIQYRVANEITELKSGSNWMSELSKSFTYDVNNRLIHEEQLLFYGNAFHPETKFEYTWDYLGQLVQSIKSVASGPGEWSLFERITYTPEGFYTALTSLEFWNGSDWSSQERTIGTWDSNSRILVYITENYYNDQWELTSRNTYSYNNPNGHLDSRTIEQYSDSTWVNDRYLVYTVDPVTTEITHIVESIWEDTVFTEIWALTYSYQNAELQELITQYNQSGIWVNQERWSYSYLDENQIVSTPTTLKLRPNIQFKKGHSSQFIIQTNGSEPAPLEIFSLKGKHIQTLQPSLSFSNRRTYIWERKNNSEGVYFIKWGSQYTRVPTL